MYAIDGFDVNNGRGGGVFAGGLYIAASPGVAIKRIEATLAPGASYDLQLAPGAPTLNGTIVLKAWPPGSLISASGGSVLAEITRDTPSARFIVPERTISAQVLNATDAYYVLEYIRLVLVT